MLDLPRVAYLVARNIDIKRAVVAADERETGTRKLLNFGHSIGHAIESCAAYSLGHGSCVALGMGAICRAAAHRGICDADVPERIVALCRAHGLQRSNTFPVDDLYAAALHDKKRAGDEIDVVLPHRIGACSIERIPLAEFRSLIEEGLSESEGDAQC